MIEPRSVSELLKAPIPYTPIGKKPIRLLACGVPTGVESIIHHLHVLRFAEVGEWSHPLPSAVEGEVIRILTRHIIINGQVNYIVETRNASVSTQMNDQKNLKQPSVVENILSETTEIGFQMASEPLTGSLLRTLAASKPNGNFLELGTGTGVSTGWLLDGMDKNSKIITVENNSAVVSIAQKYLDDQRISFHIQDAGTFLEQIKETGQQFDFIFADTWAGKYTHLEAALHALKPGGLYVIDDMLPQPNWAEGHEVKVAALVAELEDRHDLLLTKLNWASGIIIVTKQVQ